MKNTYRVEGETAIIDVVRRSGDSYECLVDLDILEQLKAQKISLSYHSRGYIQFKKDNKLVLLHRWIMNEPEAKQIDHIDTNRMNCLKSNLRVVTNKQNANNPNNNYAVGSSGVKGVDKMNDRAKCWRVRIKSKTYGYYYSLKEAEEKAREIYNLIGGV